MWVNGNGAVWRIRDEGYFWSFCSSPPPKKRGRLVVSNRISQRLISSLFVPRVRGCAFNRRVANCGSRALDTTYV